MGGGFSTISDLRHRHLLELTRVSLIPTEDIGFLEIVGEAFLSARGRGLALSPVDVELVRSYEAAAIPAAVLVRGIARATERRRAHGKPAPLSLHAIKRTLDAEARRFQAGQVRGGPMPTAETLDRLLAHAREAPLPEERAAYRAAYRAACAGEDLPEAAGLAWVTELPRPLQRLTSRAVRTNLGPRLASERREAYRERLRHALAQDALRRADLVL